MAKRKYTEKIHAQRLLRMLEKKDPCAHCPASEFFSGNNSAIDLWADEPNPHKICNEFLDFPLGSYSTHMCPCHKFGRKEALKRTWIALEEKGYLKGVK